MSAKDLLMQITVQGYLTFKDLVGNHQVSMQVGSNLEDLLASLQEAMGERLEQEAYPAGGEFGDHMVVLLNGRHSTHLPAGLSTLLQDGDEVAMFPPLAGG